MLMKILLALLKNDRDKVYLQVIDYLIAESRTIKQRYRQDCGKRMLLNDEQRRKLAELARPIIKHGFRDVISIFSPDTLMKWYRRLSAKKFDSSNVPRKPGRPATPGWVCRQVLKMARENRSWGSERIAGQISNLYFEISSETVRAILRKHNLEPGPKRDSQGTWKEFLARHWDVMWATDLFTTEVLTWRGLVTFYTCFFIRLKTREVVLGGITTNPDATFMKQIARNLTGFELKDARFIIHDRDTIYLPFDAMLPDGMDAVRLPAKSPDLNSFAERFVRSIKEECLSKFVPMGEKCLRHIITEYFEHYHHERNHQGEDIGNQLLFPDERMAGDVDGQFVTDSRLGGLLKFYYRKSA